MAPSLLGRAGSPGTAGRGGGRCGIVEPWALGPPIPESPLLVLANCFLIAFAVDAGVSLLHELLRGVGVPPGLAALRMLVAYAVLAASPVVFVWMALSPRLPKAVFLPPLLFCGWWAFGAFPVPLVAESQTEYALIGGVLQVALAAAVFLVVRRRTGGRWLLGEAELEGPSFRFQHTLWFTLVSVFLGAPFLLVQLLASTATAIETHTKGFVDFDGTGLSMTERVYNKDDREIRLVGMMHIGAGDAYRELYASFESESTVLLQEGVTDRDGRLAAGLDYEPLARALGLDVQLDPREVLGKGDDGSGAESWPHIRHADVDLAEFSQESIDFLGATAAMLTRDDLMAAFAEFRQFVDSAGPETWQRIEADVLTRRNRVLIEALDESLDEYERIIVPWGALHLPEVEAEVLARGFALGTTKRHLLFRYASILSALVQLMGQGDTEEAAAGAAAAETASPTP